MALLTIYYSLVQPHLDYCSSVWGSCSMSLSQKLQKLQNLAARVIAFSNYDCSTDELLVPDYLSSHFIFRSDTLTYNLRESDFSLAIPQPRTNYCKRSLSYSGAVLWNGLPLDIRQSLSLDVFKRKLKSYDFAGRFK